MRGASALQAVFENRPSAKLKVLAVWLPVLPSDIAPPTKSVLALLHDTRVTQYWDEDRLLSKHIRATVENEPLEIFPFLGSSRLEEPLLRYAVDAVFHGHAHRGTLEGRTVNGIPVYNVAKPLLQRTRPDSPPFFLFELPREAADTPSQS